MAWRYQPVYTEENGERYYSLCELIFDEAGNLTAHTDALIGAGGDDIESLSRDLVRMLTDVHCWEPVALADLHAGMTFHARFTQDQRNGIADYVEEVADTYKRQPRKVSN